MTNYAKQAKALLSGQFSPDSVMRSVITGMVRDGIPEKEAESLIMEILWDELGSDNWLDYVNDYRELCLQAAGGSTEAPDPTTVGDPVLTFKEAVKYMGVSENWLYKHSNKLDRIQSGKRGKLRFRKSVIDKYLRKHTTPGIGG